MGSHLSLPTGHGGWSLTSNESNESRLLRAIDENDHDAVANLIKRKPVDLDKNTALHLAIRKKNRTILHMLIDAGMILCKKKYLLFCIIAFSLL